MRLGLSTSGTSPATILWARPSTTAVLPTPGSPINTGLFLVRRARICITRRISTSRPMTGSSLPRRASSVRSRAYCSSARNVDSGVCDVTRWLPRTAASACRMASREAPWRASSCPAGSLVLAAMASRICSAETYSSLNFSASSNAASRTSFVSLLRYCCETPLTLGSRSICAAISASRVSGRTPRRFKSGGTTPSGCATSAASRCSGSSCCWPAFPAMSCASCSAS